MTNTLMVCCRMMYLRLKNDKRTIEKDGYMIDVVPISEF